MVYDVSFFLFSGINISEWGNFRYAVRSFLQKEITSYQHFVELVVKDEAINLLLNLDTLRFVASLK